MAVPVGVDFIASQLRVLQKLAGYVLTPGRPEWNDRATDHLAQQIHQAGIADIRDIGFYVRNEVGTVQKPTRYSCGDAECYGTEPVAIPFTACGFYHRKTNAPLPIGYSVSKPCDPYAYTQGVDQALNQCGNQDNCPDPASDEIDVGFGQDLGDRYFVWYRVQFIGPAPGVPLFIGRIHRDKSTWESIRAGLTFIGGVVVAFVPGIGQAVGTYVFGAATAAQYPALVQIATNAAFNATLGGQDIEHAVGRALAAFAGAQAGAFAGGQLDSTLIAKMTASATTTLLTGGDVQQAVAGTALSYAAANAPKAVASLVSSPAPPPPAPAPVPVIVPPPTFAPVAAPESNMDDFDYPPDVTEVDYAFGGEVELGVGFNPQELSFGLDGELDTSFSEFGGDGSEVFTFGGDDGSMMYPADDGMIDLSGDPYIGGGANDLPANVPPMSPSDTAGWSWSDVAAGISTAAIAALKVYSVYKASGSPQVAVTGPAQTANRSGTVTTRSPNGTVSVGKPPVGQPLAVGDGSLIMNNGDGTYTVIGADGSRSVQRYPGTSGGGLSLGGLNQQQLLIGGAIGLGVLLLMRGGGRR